MISRPRRPDRAVYVPRARRSQTTPPATTTITPNDTSDTNLLTNTTESTASDSTNKDISHLPTQIRTRSSAPASPAAKQSQLPATGNCANHQDITINACNVQPSHSELNSNEINHCDTLNRNGSTLELPVSNVVNSLHLGTFDQIPQQSAQTENMDNNTSGGIGLRIEDVQFDQTLHNAKEDKDEKELQRASKVSTLLTILRHYL